MPFSALNSPDCTAGGFSRRFSEQLFLMPAAFSEGHSGTIAMLLGLFHGQRSASSASAVGGFSLGIYLVERRGVRAISEDAGGENLLEEAYAKSCEGVESPVQLPMIVFLEFGHVRYRQIRPNYLPKVLSMSKLGGASSMAQFVVRIPLQLVEVWENGSNENIVRKAARLMEDDIGATVPEPEISCAYFDGHSSERSTLKAPEPEPEPPL